MRTASSADTSVASTATPRITTRKLRGTKASSSAANSGQQMMRVSIDMLSQRKIEDQGHAHGEQEGVGLQVAGLEQA
jgi:hypothetical protein